MSIRDPIKPHLLYVHSYLPWGSSEAVEVILVVVAVEVISGVVDVEVILIVVAVEVISVVVESKMINEPYLT